MTFTRGIGVVCGAIIDRIVRWLALSKIHPNVLTFLGLVINIWAAWLFSKGSFKWAGAVVIGAGHPPGDPLRRLLRFRYGPLFRPGALHGPAGLLRLHQSLLLHHPHRHRD